MSTVARHIKKQRIQKGMTQDSLAGQLFVTRQTVSNWETGRSQPDIDTLVRIAEVLQTDVSVLIYGPTQKPNQEGALRGLCISGGITLLLGLFYMIGMPIARDVSRRLFMLTPYLLLQTIIAPILLFMLGWTLLQGLFTAGLLKPLSKGRKPLFFCFLWSSFASISSNRCIRRRTGRCLISRTAGSCKSRALPPGVFL